MKPVELSLRLKSIADMVSKGNCVYDVGCDHGFLSIYLVQQGIAVSAKAMDVRTGPLAAAKEHVANAKLESKIECILSDGLHEAPMPAKNTTLVIAGMGGPLIVRILEECPKLRDSFDELVLSPQSQIEEFRRDIRKQGLKIIDENMVYDEGKYYTLVRCIPKAEIYDSEDTEIGVSICSRVADKYGYFLLKNKNEVLVQFLDYEKGLLSEVLSHLDKESHLARYEEVIGEIHLNDLATQLINRD